MKTAITTDQIIDARSEIHDMAGRLLSADWTDADSLRLARRIAALAPMLLIGIEERQHGDR